MQNVKKITFPYFLDHSRPAQRAHTGTVVFFGTNFCDLPIGWNMQGFIQKTNQMLAYIRKHFPEHRLLYQAHPNETKEASLIDLSGFEIGEPTIAEVFLYRESHHVDYVFSALSSASISAYAMGYRSAIFIDTLMGAVTEEYIERYRHYFAGLPDTFFIRSFDTSPPTDRLQLSVTEEDAAFQEIARAVGDTKTLWVLAADPAIALRASICIARIKRISPELRAVLVKSPNKRWDAIAGDQNVFAPFDTVHILTYSRVRYSLRPRATRNVLRVARELKKIPIAADDTIISLSNLMFEENCLLSYNPGAQKILLTENRWYDFIYQQHAHLPVSKKYTTAWGVRFFNYVLEPLLGLHRTIFMEYQDGKGTNFFRYAKPLEKIYSKVFVLMPDR